MKRTKRVIILIAVVIAVSCLIWWLVSSVSDGTSGDIHTSGFIEARDVVVALESGGRVVEVAADEGDDVSSGEVMVKVDDALLLAQQEQAAANVRLAQASLAQATANRDGAEQAWRNALDVQSNPLELEGRIISAGGELEMAVLELLRQESIEVNMQVSSAEVRLEIAEAVLENYEKAESTVGGFSSQYDRHANVLQAEKELALAEINLDYRRALAEQYTLPAAALRYRIARDGLDNLLAIRENPQDINATVDQTYASFQIAVAAAEAAGMQVAQARASLEVVEVQLEKVTAVAPLSGVVAARYVEEGEIVQAGTPVLTITQLDVVTLTAYVPESRIGLVKLGQQVRVSVDSYPDDRFTGEVVFISPRAQFTPQNVQLKEEREKTVFAVKVRLDNPEQKLKPGMPADAQILTGLGE